MAVIKMNFFSATLGMQTNVTICLPTFSIRDGMKGLTYSDVYMPGRKYQVLWLLHGGTGDDSDYLHYSNIARYAEEHKLAVVMPADYNALYTDDPKGAKYFTYVADELPKLLNAVFPFSDKRKDNFIAGLSMGSTGAFKLAVAFPEKYCAALCMSGCARGPSNPKDGIAHSPVPPFITGDPRGVDDAWNYVEEQVERGKSMPRFFLTCGSDDTLAYLDYTTSVDRLKTLGLDVFYEEGPGYQHEWDFWDLSLQKAICSWLPILHREV